MTAVSCTPQTCIGDVPFGGGVCLPVDWNDDDDDEAAQKKSSLCCLEGCLAVSAIGFSFFVALPTGIILVVLAIKNHDVALISVGVVLISLPVLMLLIVVLLCLNQQRISRWLPWKTITKKLTKPSTNNNTTYTTPSISTISTNTTNISRTTTTTSTTGTTTAANQQASTISTISSPAMTSPPFTESPT